MTALKVVFAQKATSQYFAKNIIDLNETPKLDSVSILAKYEYDLSDIIEKAENASND